MALPALPVFWLMRRLCTNQSSVASAASPLSLIVLHLLIPLQFHLYILMTNRTGPDQPHETKRKTSNCLPIHSPVLPFTRCCSQQIKPPYHINAWLFLQKWPVATWSLVCWLERLRRCTSVLPYVYWISNFRDSDKDTNDADDDEEDEIWMEMKNKSIAYIYAHDVLLCLTIFRELD